MTLANIYRLQGTKAIEEVKSRGKLIQSDNFGIIFLKRNDSEVSKFAFIVSKKISNLAVHRNRLDRALNEGVRRCLARVPKGYSFVFLAKATIEKRRAEEIIREVELLFTGLKLE